MAALVSTRAVARFSTDTTLVRDVSEDMILLEPNDKAGMLFVLTAAAKRKEGSDAPKFEWFEDSEVTLWGQTNGAVSSVATDITVMDITVFAAGDLVVVPGATTVTSEEVMLVTAIAGTTTGTITVTRDISTAAANDTIAASSALRILASALTEDSDTPTQRYQAQTPKASYCQIFRTPVKITHTAASTKKYGGNDRKYQLVKALIRHRSEIEGVGILGRAYESLSGSASRWASMGVKYAISTNKTNASTTLTQTVFNNFCETAFRFGENRKLLIAAPKVLSAINSFAQGKLNAYTDDDAYGVQLQRYIAPLGEFMLKNNYRMEDGISGKLGFADEAIVVDLPSVKLRYLDGGEGKIGDTKLYLDVEKDGTTVQTDEYRSQMGWEVRHEKKHALLYNCTAYS